jgi:Lar family restriction alleviation protein
MTLPKLPCPFCGGSRQYWESMLIDDGYQHYLICKDCGCEGPSKDSKKVALYFWDRRRGTDVTEPIVAKFLSDVDVEIKSARAKHPGNAHLMAALMEEVGELAKAHLEDETHARIWAEAKQVACVAARIATEGDADFETAEVPR